MVDMKKKATDILEDYSNSYSQVDLETLTKFLEQIKAEAIKEFAEKFKKTIEDIRYNAIDTPYTRACNAAADWCIEIANSLKKEMVGDNK